MWATKRVNWETVTVTVTVNVDHLDTISHAL